MKEKVTLSFKLVRPAKLHGSLMSVIFCDNLSDHRYKADPCRTVFIPAFYILDLGQQVFLT